MANKKTKRNRKIVAYLLAGASAVWALRKLYRMRNRLHMRNQIVVISGGSRGLGLVLARKLADAGARLALLARDPAELERARLGLYAPGAEVIQIACDITIQEQAEAAIHQVIDHYGGIDVLINNAGVIQVGPMEHMKLEDYQNAMNVHFWGPLYLILAALPSMKAQGGGSIINITSIGGAVAVPHLLPYTASKFALLGLSDGLRAELAKDNIDVTTVIPGLMQTGSPVNALYKGQREMEYQWFSVFDSLPVSSISAGRAADQIIDALEHGDPSLTISLPAEGVKLANWVFPGLTAMGMKLFNMLLPGPSRTPGGDLAMPGRMIPNPAPNSLIQSYEQAAINNNELGEVPAAGEEEIAMEHPGAGT